MLVYPLLNFLCLAGFGVPIEIRGRDLFEVGILGSKSAKTFQSQHSSGVLTSLPNLFVVDSFSTRLLIILATLLAML